MNKFIHNEKYNFSFVCCPLRFITQPNEASQHHSGSLELIIYKVHGTHPKRTATVKRKRPRLLFSVIEDLLHLSPSSSGFDRVLHHLTHLSLDGRVVHHFLQIIQTTHLFDNTLHRTISD